MFTGIVEERGIVQDAGETWLVVSCERVVDGLVPGASVNVNGCCLTATEIAPDGFVADLMAETRQRTTLGGLDHGQPVNLERPVPADGRFGGHLVQGHVDGVAQISSVEADEDGTLLRIAAPQALAGYLVEKGSVAVDGCSLTVIDVEDPTSIDVEDPTSRADDAVFSVGLVPHTLAATTLGRLVAGDRVNLEVDVVAKYVERLLRSGVDTPHGS